MNPQPVLLKPHRLACPEPWCRNQGCRTSRRRLDMGRYRSIRDAVSGDSGRAESACRHLRVK